MKSLAINSTIRISRPISAFGMGMQLIRSGGIMENLFGQQCENRLANMNTLLTTCFSTLIYQGKISATYFWPGSDVNFPPEQQRTPNYFFKYNKNTSFKIRVDQVLKWMDLPSGKRPSITTLYFEEPDSTGHKTGPNTSNVLLNDIPFVTMDTHFFPLGDRESSCCRQANSPSY